MEPKQEIAQLKQQVGELQRQVTELRSRVSASSPLSAVPSAQLGVVSPGWDAGDVQFLGEVIAAGGPFPTTPGAPSGYLLVYINGSTQKRAIPIFS